MDYDWTNKTVLIAEDSDMNFIILKTSLAVTKASILWAKNGREVIKLVEETARVDVVVMDLNMPVMDGYKATEQIRKKGYDMPIIAQSAFTLKEEKHKITKAGCNDYISKPINKKELLEKINFHIG